MVIISRFFSSVHVVIVLELRKQAFEFFGENHDSAEITPVIPISNLAFDKNLESLLWFPLSTYIVTLLDLLSFS